MPSGDGETSQRLAMTTLRWVGGLASAAASDLVVKNMPSNAGDTGDSGSIPGLGRTPGGGTDNPL